MSTALYAENQIMLMRAMRQLLDDPHSRQARDKAESLLASMDTPEELSAEIPALLREQVA